ncbi:radical SAM protein [Desulfurispora thermophila]|uniref:radical SAM protein n=1 Tax=Desulfurispora thermophila TaxID=265470 RepID=UPI000382C528|nr:radical SAM protein [Desulfurispora thermophila]
MLSQTLFFETGPIRPPSEAGSLLLRLTRNCPWNRCAFCITYRGQQFSRRDLPEILNDIDSAAALRDEVIQLSFRLGLGGRIDRQLLAHLYQQGGECHWLVAHWLAHGGQTVFLQDANSLLLPTAQLVEILLHIRKRLPGVERITSYARASTLARKTISELQELAGAGLNRLHVGMESGSDEVLRLVNKGTTAAQLVEAGQKARRAGLEISYYVMPGLGGKNLSKQHARESARVLNEANPHFIRLRTLTVLPGTPLAEMVARGQFVEMNEDEIVHELRLFVENLHCRDSMLTSDHSMNLLEELTGRLPQQKQQMLDTIEAYLSLPATERLNFQLGKRWGVYRRLADRLDAGKRRQVEQAVQQLRAGGRLEQTIASLRRQVL